MSKLIKLYNKYILPKLSSNKFFIDKNGKPSSKRLAGLSIIFAVIIATFLFKPLGTSETLLLGLATVGAGLLGLPKDQTL